MTVKVPGAVTFVEKQVGTMAQYSPDCSGCTLGRTRGLVTAPEIFVPLNFHWKFVPPGEKFEILNVTVSPATAAWLAGLT
jgi:hypothetical protein